MVIEYILDKDGKTPIPEPDSKKWGQWMGGASVESGFQNPHRQVARDEIGEVLISTVFLGIDHNFTGNGPPILFETMVFRGSLDQEQDRYCTWDEAKAGHRVMVEKVTSAVPDTVPSLPIDPQ